MELKNRETIFSFRLFVQLCAIDETPFEMEWILMKTQQTLENEVPVDERRSKVEIFLPFDRMKNFLVRQGSLTKARAKKYFSLQRRNEKIEETIQQLTERTIQHRLSLTLEQRDSISRVEISLLRMKLFLIIFCRHVTLSLFSLLSSTRTWLFTFILLICAFESSKMTPNNPSITIFRVVFEVISAFGGCGLSMGLSTTSSSLADSLTVPSRICLIFVMCIGRHRGLLDSMKDQEEIEYSAQTIIHHWKQKTVQRHQKRQNFSSKTNQNNENLSDQPEIISTRF